MHELGIRVESIILTVWNNISAEHLPCVFDPLGRKVCRFDIGNQHGKGREIVTNSRHSLLFCRHESSSRTTEWIKSAVISTQAPFVDKGMYQFPSETVWKIVPAMDGAVLQRHRSDPPLPFLFDFDVVCQTLAAMSDCLVSGSRELDLNRLAVNRVR